MFLNLLQQNQKEAFLELAHVVAEVDGMMNEKEKVVMAMYMNEMEIGDYEVKNLSLDDILIHFDDDRAKNIAFMEVLGLIFSDDSGYKNPMPSVY